MQPLMVLLNLMPEPGTIRSNPVVKLHDGTGTGGSLELQVKFGSEGLDLMVPGSGIRFRTGVYLDLDQTDSVTIGYTG